MSAAVQLNPAKAPIAAVWRVVGLASLSDAAVRLWLWYRKLHVESESGAFPPDPMTANALGWSVRKTEAVRAELVRARLLIVKRRGPQPQAYFPLDPANPVEPLNLAGLQPPFSAGQGTNDPQVEPPNPAGAYKERTCKPVKPSPKGPEKAGRDTWLTPFIDAWKEQYGGNLPPGRLASVFKPLVDEHGSDEVLVRWRCYLSDTPARFNPTPEKFTSTYGSWSPAADPAIVRALRERDRA